MTMTPATVATLWIVNHITFRVFVREIVDGTAFVHLLHNDGDYCGLFRKVPVAHLSDFRIEMVAV